MKWIRSTSVNEQPNWLCFTAMCLFIFTALMMTN